MLIHSLRLSLLLPAILLLANLPPTHARAELQGRPGSAKVQAHYVIVTDFGLAPAFEALASHKRSHGTSAIVVTTEQITALYPEGRDLAESIRLLLKDAHQYWATRFVLLGGGPQIVPTRWVIYPNPTPQVPSTPSDLYYAALDGDWDADGDGVFGELPSPEEPGDDIDTIPELMVGRAPVRDLAEASNFVAKTLRFLESTHSATEKKGLALASTLPENTDVSLSQYSEAILEAALGSSTAPPVVERRYSDHVVWPGSMPLDAGVALDLLDDGDHDWVFAMLPCGAEGLGVADEVLDLETLASLEGSPHEFVFVTIGPEAAGVHETGVLETLLRTSTGGAVAAVGPGTTSFVVPGQAFLRQFMTTALAEPGTTLGEAFVAAQSVDPPTGNFEIRAHAGWFLLGDPQLTLHARSVVATPMATASVELYPPHPNPFNPVTEIVYELSSRERVELAIFDVRGRLLRPLVRGVREPGLHRALWNGRDDQGKRVASGVYVVTIEVGGRALSRKLTLVR